ncbi:hypothetical protein PR002_g22775 [Phytophthora rubi]|uniref:Crinkler effector protein N-terminal domain-containing protein n=1 Tax=Phytophthora rubi TaxID=129364 RepID=A0A6A3ISD6_9STRA|nr:hypothetical protein PR002_g22775 [Phytophthora rubi]
MVKLFCAVVGVAGSAFEVDIDEVASVSALKKAIKEEKKNKLDKVDADALQLFLAKKDGAWLKDDDPAALELEEGNTHQDIQTLIDGEKMKATARSKVETNPRAGGGSGTRKRPLFNHGSRRGTLFATNYNTPSPRTSQTMVCDQCNDSSEESRGEPEDDE